MTDWSLDDVVINGAYVMSVLALAVRDVLRLRLLLLVAQVCFLWWGALLEHLPTMLWNGLFIVINAAVIARILWERRPLEVPEGARDLHERLFPGMSARDFLFFWELGNPHRLACGTLVRRGEHPEALTLILDGRAQVLRDGTQLAELARGDFVAEMSLLSGDPASADVVTRDGVAYVSWSRRKLEQLERLNPEVFLQLHKALGRDVSAKVGAAGTTAVGAVARSTAS